MYPADDGPTGPKRLNRIEPNRLEYQVTFAPNDPEPVREVRRPANIRHYTQAEILSIMRPGNGR
jgi:hypothetical protein